MLLPLLVVLVLTNLTNGQYLQNPSLQGTITINQTCFDNFIIQPQGQLQNQLLPLPVAQSGYASAYPGPNLPPKVSPNKVVNVGNQNLIPPTPAVPGYTGNNYGTIQPQLQPQPPPPSQANNFNLIPVRPASRAYDNDNLFGSPIPVVNAFLDSTTRDQYGGFNKPKLEVAYQWRFVDWINPSIQLTGKNLILGNPLTQDVDIDRKGRVFVTTPQWLAGVPITLSIITPLNGPGGPLLTPYPTWAWHQNNCNGLTSVYRIRIDECNRLWMVDTGFSTSNYVCPMKIVVFDLSNDELLFTYEIPENQTVGRTAQYVNPEVEVGNGCEDTFLYVADVIKHGLLVYSLRENRSWRLDNPPNNAFGHDPEATSITIAGERISLTDGTLGVALSPPGFFDRRYLYFNSLASFYQKFADADSLKRSFQYEPIIYQSNDRRISQAGVHAISKDGAMFFQLAQYTALACWNIERRFSPENIVLLAQDETTLQYISGMKIVINAKGEEELWFNTNRLQKTINKSRRIDEVNFRLIRAKVDDLIRGTRCESTGFRNYKPNLNGWNRI